jgi:hypothetical protein
MTASHLGRRRSQVIIRSPRHRNRHLFLQRPGDATHGSAGAEEQDQIGAGSIFLIRTAREGAIETSIFRDSLFRSVVGREIPNSRTAALPRKAAFENLRAARLRP